ncbi:MAG TPA: 4'-phosphopantetheinyl transferase superfamily protein [Chryseosolibacter sp.]
MPVERFYHTPDSVWGFWKVAEDEALLNDIVAVETVPADIVNPLKRLEFLAGRALIQSLLQRWDLPYHGLMKDAFGKPFLSNSRIQISLSHSYPYVAAVVHRHKNVGIDLEQPKEKLLKVAPRILAGEELKDAGDNVVKHCVYWCAKETLIKIHGKKYLILSKNLLVTPFSLREKGHLIGRIIANDTETAIPLEYYVYDNFVVAVSGS